MNGSGYDRLARCYRLPETLAFGRALERARFRHFDRLRTCKHLLPARRLPPQRRVPPGFFVT